MRVLLLIGLCLFGNALADDIPPYSRDAFSHSLDFMGKPAEIGFYSGKNCITEWDHVVSLKDAWDSGAWSWSDDERTDYAQNAFNLRPACFQINRSKGSSTPSDFLRKSKDGKGVDFEFAKGQWCEYLSIYSLIKGLYQLSPDNNDKGLFKDRCDDKNVALYNYTPLDRIASKVISKEADWCGTPRIQAAERAKNKQTILALEKEIQVDTASLKKKGYGWLEIKNIQKGADRACRSPNWKHSDSSRINYYECYVNYMWDVTQVKK